MAMIQTPHGRVIGLIVHEGNQPQAQAAEAVKEEAKQEPATPAKRAGRPSKK